MPGSTVLIVDPVSSGALYAPLLAEAGVETILLDTDRARIAGLRSAPTPGAYNFEADFDGSADRLLGFCRERSVGYVIAGSESGIELCEYLRERLDGCPANDPVWPQRRWNKEHMFNGVAAAGVPCLETSTVAPGEKIPESDLARVGGGRRVVVKPALGAGSVDVRMADTEEALRDAVEAIHNSPGFFGDHPGALIQEMFPTPFVEYVVDSYSVDGKHEILAVCAYDKRLSANGDFLYERVRWLDGDEPVVASLVDYAGSVLDALGVRIGPVHMEVMVGDSMGPRLIDFGARAHGAGHPLKTFRLTGSSQVHRECEYVVHLLDPQRQPRPPAREYRLDQRGAIVFFSLDEASECTHTPDAQRLAELPGVIEVSVSAREGQHYPATRSLIDSLALGLVFICADDNEQLDERCAAVRETFSRSFGPARVP